LEVDRWFIVALIGVIIGLIAALLKQSITALGVVQWNKTNEYLKVNVRHILNIAQNNRSPR
jgi:hypothetical protein